MRSIGKIDNGYSFAFVGDLKTETLILQINFNMENKLLTNWKAANDANMLLAAGASRWVQREYEINFSPSDYFKAQTQMKEQDEQEDDIILLKVDYNIMQGKAKITDKVCLFNSKK